jgi:hypothetical protein
MMEPQQQSSVGKKKKKKDWAVDNPHEFGGVDGRAPRRGWSVDEVNTD